MGKWLDYLYNRPQDKHIFKVLLTGGPCSGKTTTLGALQNQFSRFGIKVYTVPEVATQLINGGLSFVGITTEQSLLYQRSLFELQLVQERVFVEIAMMHPGSCLVICDRGLMDGKAYCSEENWQAILDWFGVHDFMIRDTQYDAVFHMVTAADGAEEFYTSGNNVARWETAEQAREQDAKTLQTYVGHPRLQIIDNSTDFAGKIEKVVSKIAQMMGVLPETYTYRRFLIHNPPKEIPVKHVSLDVDIILLHGSNLHDENRIILRGDRATKKFTCIHQKFTRVQGRTLVTETFIDRTTYATLLENMDPDTEVIEKRNTAFVYQKNYFEMGVFLNCNLEGLALLYCEPNAENLQLPDFLEIEREVTDEEQFSSWLIARGEASNCDEPTDERESHGVLSSGRLSPVFLPQHRNSQVLANMDCDVQALL